MRLTAQDIRQITVGAVRTEERADGIHFFRCTEKQIEAFSALRPELGVRATATTGVQLDFHTDSAHLSFRASAGRKFELYIDNVLRKQYLMDDYRARGEAVKADLCDPLGDPAGEVRVTLYFPNHETGGVLESLELDDGATFRPHGFDHRMLMLGDSITQGYNSKYNSLSYALRVSRHFNAESVIQGVGGAFFHESTFDILPFTPDIVTVAFGTNDFGYFATLEEMRLHTAAYLEKVARAYRNSSRIFVISPIWRDHREGKKMGSFASARAVVREEAERLGLIHIDGLLLMPPEPEFFADGYLHPNDNGFGIFAENLIIEMEKHLS